MDRTSQRHEAFAEPLPKRYLSEAGIHARVSSVDFIVSLSPWNKLEELATCAAAMEDLIGAIRRHDDWIVRRDLRPRKDAATGDFPTQHPISLRAMNRRSVGAFASSALERL